MIRQYVKAENLKFKRTFSRKMIFLVPFINMCCAFFMNLGYFVSGTYNWWSIILMPVLIALLCALSHQKEKKAANYNGIFSLPIQLHMMWYAKTGVIAIYSLASQMVFLGFMFVMQLIIPQFATVNLTVMTASLLLWITTLWEIPLCLFIARKFGFIAAVILNLLASVMSVMMSAASALWWLNPWSWSIRVMCPAIGIHPNGLPLETGDPLKSWSVVPLAVVLSVLLCAVLLMLTRRSFSPAGDRGAIKREAV
ncbi:MULTISPECIES: lantibiotic immunity ABC transporter MutE/EpiE family permease subunit [Bacillus]|uniref:lantibiotic immunity ABC transporter MutE/EpiE family permease subunit n=1 Tax=Bacillus TaxID=1386 RepID=UPI00040910D7|nr:MULTISPECIES: lantibiotic immunity ABC transporter MutE/EpiE family permease subunit [Bacillus]QHZ48739.1 lantibiotic immunity ABC transporter MutE/EpiE family permease subunit [Bacillus sp. NSP9.1]WFA05619.1 lantibiotic immunity ABC transporter MutE/EpiE family permease subunit [Bacillus sp. HSf4]